MRRLPVEDAAVVGEHQPLPPQAVRFKGADGRVGSPQTVEIERVLGLHGIRTGKGVPGRVRRGRDCRGRL